jgi:hypothetical protein
MDSSWQQHTHLSRPSYKRTNQLLDTLDIYYCITDFLRGWGMDFVRSGRRLGVYQEFLVVVRGKFLTTF